MATIHCRPGVGLRPSAPPLAALDVGKPRAGWASRSGLLEGALRALLRDPLGGPAPSTTSQVQLTADRCSWSRAAKGWR